MPDPFALGTKAELVMRLSDAVQTVIQSQDGNFFGRTTVFLEGRREQVRTQETNLGNLTADANLAIAQAFDSEVKVSLKNGGGIRAQIGEIVDLGGGEVSFNPPPANPETGKEEGQVSELDIKNSLRFNNALTVLDLSAQDLLEVVEHAVSATAPGSTPGQFPQIGGMAFSFDPDNQAGQRVQTLVLQDANGNTTETIVENGTVVGDPSRVIKIVTLNFLADGGDGYPYPALG
jgi:2',3'-cyclic-nucleotide 2'-phosphodiesterase (5'-nucleotidase family)